MRDLVDDYLDVLVLEQGLAQNTRLAYDQDLSCLLEWLRDRGLERAELVDERSLRLFLREQRASGSSPATVSRRRAALRGFFSYLCSEGLCSSSPADKLEAPRLAETIPTTLSHADVERLIASPSRETPLGLRDAALLEMLYATGARISELTAVDASAVVSALSAAVAQSGYATLRVLGKGSKERQVLLSPRAAATLELYLSGARPKLLRRPERALLVTQRGRRLERRHAWRLVKQNLRRAGLPERASPHTLRHSFASHLLASGADLRVLQELLGHAKVTTTQRYTHIERDRLRSYHDRFHPLGRGCQLPN
jgi:integrase/recombinase XerD